MVNCEWSLLQTQQSRLPKSHPPIRDRSSLPSHDSIDALVLESGPSLIYSWTSGDILFFLKSFQAQSFFCRWKCGHRLYCLANVCIVQANLNRSPTALHDQRA